MHKIWEFGHERILIYSVYASINFTSLSYFAKNTQRATYTHPYSAQKRTPGIIYSNVCPSRNVRLRRKFRAKFSAKRVCLLAVGAFDIVSVETCQSSFRAGRIRRYVRGHVAGNRVDAGGGTHSIRCPGCIRARARARVWVYAKQCRQPSPYIIHRTKGRWNSG